MDMLESIKPVIKYWWLVVLTIVIVLGGIYLNNQTKATSYDGYTTVFVRQTVVGPGEAIDYGFDGYYAVQAGQGFADTIETWLKSPEFVAEIYQKAGLDVPTSAGALTGLFDIEKVVSQSIAVKVGSGDKNTAQALLDGMTQVVRERAETMLKTVDGQSLFTIETSPVLVLEHEVDVRLQYGVGFLGGLGIGLFLAYLTYAWREDNKGKKRK